MIELETRRKRKYVNFEYLGRDLEEILSKLHISIGHEISGLDKIVEEKKDKFIKETKNFIVLADSSINKIIGDTLDNLYYGPTEDASYTFVNLEEKRKCITLKNVGEVLSGRFYASCSLNDRKSRRLWKWKDRLAFVQGFFEEHPGEERYELNQMLSIIKGNSYLKKTHRDIYERLSFYLNK
jgi:hypothetical protein